MGFYGVCLEEVLWVLWSLFRGGFMGFYGACLEEVLWVFMELV